MINSAFNESNKLRRVLQFVPGFRSGGVETLLMELYRCLDKKKIQFDFIVDTKDKLPEFQEISEGGGRVFQMGRYLDSPINYQRELNKVLLKYSDEYSVLHCHSVIRAFPVLWAARRYDIQKRILHSHSHSLQGSKFAYFAPIITTLTIPLATDLLACSEAAGRYFFHHRHFNVFSNTIRVQRFMYSQLDRIRVRKRYGIGGDSMVVGHTGRFTHLKNHDFLLRVFAELNKAVPDAHLILVGEGPLEKKYRGLAADLGVADNVVFAGLQADVPSFLSAMDVFVLPSHFEGFGISLLEAQANGLPCLASSVIQREVQVTPSVTTLSLDDSVANWCNELRLLHQKGRRGSSVNSDLIAQAGYDTETELVNLQKIYSLDS